MPWGTFVGVIVPATVILIIWTMMAHHFATQRTNRSPKFIFDFYFKLGSKILLFSFSLFQSFEEEHTEDGLHHGAFSRNQCPHLHPVPQCYTGWSLNFY